MQILIIEKHIKQDLAKKNEIFHLKEKNKRKPFFFFLKTNLAQFSRINLGVPSCFWLADYEQKPAVWTDNETMSKRPCKRKKIKISKERESIYTVHQSKNIIYIFINNKSNASCCN